MTPTIEISESKRKQYRIRLTGRKPVLIYDDEWPVIAAAKDDSFAGSGEYHYRQALAARQVDVYSLCVRQHADGRTIVYGRFIPHVGSSAEGWEGGQLLPSGSDIAAAIERVGRDAGIPDRVIRECIGDLPAEEL